MKNYKAHLFLEAQVPENQSLVPHIKYSIEYYILCPINGCEEIKANGFDSKFSHPVQFYYCNVHRKVFYAHTSWVMRQFTEIVIQIIIIQSFSTSTLDKDVAEIFSISAPSLSRLLNHSKKYVDQVIDRVNQQR